jgi:glycosyltransferase involved in cell wall biosynthesis
MSSDPRVSIIIPVYNGANYLRDALKSALAQTYRNIEIIVVNDGSDDGGRTESIALSFGDKICYFRKEHSGVAATLNYAISRMTGEYFSWLSHDDEYYPRKIESQIAFLRRLGRPAVVYGDFDIAGAGGIVFSSARNLGLKPGHLRYSLCVGAPIHGCTLLIPKSYFDEVGLFDETIPTTQDYDLWFKMASKHDFEYLPELMVKLRAHAAQGSASAAHLLECDDMAEKFLAALKDDPLPNAEKAELLLTVACRLKRKRCPRSSQLAYQMSQALDSSAWGKMRYRFHCLMDPAYRVRRKMIAWVRRFS